MFRQLAVATDGTTTACTAQDVRRSEQSTDSAGLWVPCLQCDVKMTLNNVQLCLPALRP